MTVEQLIQQLVSDGGAIVCTADCLVLEISEAQAAGRFAMNANGFGFVRRTKEQVAFQHPDEPTTNIVNDPSLMAGAPA